MYFPCMWCVCVCVCVYRKVHISIASNILSSHTFVYVLVYDAQYVYVMSVCVKSAVLTSRIFIACAYVYKTEVSGEARVNTLGFCKKYKIFFYWSFV